MRCDARVVVVVAVVVVAVAFWPEGNWGDALWRIHSRDVKGVRVQGRKCKRD